ncbi:MAG: molybdopterin-dependent oxidoreductase [Myxococcales bacterium]|nr:molybdopterin-dependent oxidoreductase [Myxococcales bacterium]
MRRVLRTCPLCEATCGLALTLDGDDVVRVEGDPDDPLSRGFLCPKGATIGALHADPDRLRAPLVRRGDALVECTWDEAFAAVAEGLERVVAAHGKESVGVYLGNPNVHTLAGPFYVPAFVRALGTGHVFSASTVDQMPQHLASGLMFGHPDRIPVPDLDRTDWLLMLGANPVESNGSLCTAPDFPGRLKALRARGGRLIVVDPRRTRTADLADEHLAIRPGTDALLLWAMVQVLFAEDRVDLRDLAPHVEGVEALRDLAAPFTPETVAGHCRVPAEVIRELARGLAAAERGCVYARIGAHTTAFGTLAAWAVGALNVLTGNLDRPGGSMFPRSALGRPHPGGRGRGFAVGRWRSRVSGRPEVRGEVPSAVLAEEMSTPGPGQLRALFTIAGNPARSLPDSAGLERALGGLDLLVCVDPYLNETTRLADVVLPPPGPLARAHYDVAFGNLMVRNVARYTPPTLAADGPDECDIVARLTLIASGAGAQGDPAWVTMGVLGHLAKGAAAAGAASEAELLAASAGESGPEAILDLLLRTGPYPGLSLDALRAAPSGVDLGPLQPCVPDVLSTPSGRIELAPASIVDDVPRLAALLDDAPVEGLLLVGRRHLRSNNSWGHNVPRMAGGTNRCTLQMHPDDAAARGLRDGDVVAIASRVGRVEAPLEVTDRIAAGVVSLPHGWGHDAPGARLRVAAKAPGVNSNLLTDGAVTDPLSGNAGLNGIPVEVAASV